MTHLAPERLVALAERGAAGSDPHLAGCERCRAAVEAMRQTLRAAAGIEVPEPSPLFWEHLSRRVADAVRLEPPPRRGRSWRAWPWPVAAPLGAAAAIVAIATASWWFVQSQRGSSVNLSSPAGRVVVDAGPASRPVNLEAEDEAWLVVATAAEVLDAETADATGMTPAPGSVEEAAGELPVPEREELDPAAACRDGRGGGDQGVTR